MRLALLSFALSVAIAPLAWSQRNLPARSDTDFATDIHETIARVPVTVTLPEGGIRSGDMLITTFRPDGTGPFPALIMSHGRSAKDRDKPERFRAMGVARFWVRRGFAVFVPTRLGYGATGVSPDTEFSGNSCEARTFGPMAKAASHQIATAVEFVRQQPFVARDKIILMGQSVGGFATTVANSLSLPGVIAAVNFSGGAGGDPQGHRGKPCSPERLQRFYADAGATAKTPMLWVYAQNDGFWGAEVPRAWHRAYVQKGATAEFVMLPPYGEEGHFHIDKVSNWRAPVDAFIAKLGFAPPRSLGAPPATLFAKVSEAHKVPIITDAVRNEGYAKFLSLDLPRAFVIGASGHFSYYGGVQDALSKAMAQCAAAQKAPCKPYAVDDAVVWVP